jgi:hypothetical protein
MRKSVKTYDGNFSKVEFDLLESKKKEFRSKALIQRVEVARLVTKAAKAYTTLTET